MSLPRAREVSKVEIQLKRRRWICKPRAVGHCQEEGRKRAAIVNCRDIERGFERRGGGLWVCCGDF